MNPTDSTNPKKPKQLNELPPVIARSPDESGGRSNLGEPGRAQMPNKPGTPTTEQSSLPWRERARVRGRTHTTPQTHRTPPISIHLNESPSISIDPCNSTNSTNSFALLSLHGNLGDPAELGKVALTYLVSLAATIDGGRPVIIRKECRLERQEGVSFGLWALFGTWALGFGITRSGPCQSSPFSIRTLAARCRL
jgi:hypothetical protein